VLLGRCALCLYDGAGGGSDSCDAAPFMCCQERRGRGVLGIQLLWRGDAFCRNFLLLLISALRAVWVQHPRVTDGVGLCSLEMTEPYSTVQLPLLLLD